MHCEVRRRLGNIWKIVRHAAANAKHDLVELPDPETRRIRRIVERELSLYGLVLVCPERDRNEEISNSRASKTLPLRYLCLKEVPWSGCTWKPTRRFVHSPLCFFLMNLNKRLPFPSFLRNSKNRPSTVALVAPWLREGTQPRSINFATSEVGWWLLSLSKHFLSRNIWRKRAGGGTIELRG